jgi:hypothetical protein
MQRQVMWLFLMATVLMPALVGAVTGHPLKVGQSEYDCRCSKMYGMPVTGGRGFSALKPLWYKGVPP